MSRFTQYNKSNMYYDNLNYANQKKERRTNEEMQEIERDRIAMERLQVELDQEKKLEQERKNQIKKQQFEDYSNYMRQKYGDNPQNVQRINVKETNEQKSLRKPNYYQQMDNLCLNPTKQANIYPMEPVKNFSEEGRNYQRGYSHGYNILTGESYSQQGQTGKKTPKNVRTNMNRNLEGANRDQLENPIKTEYINEPPNQTLNKEKDDLSKYQAYMEMKRQKEEEEYYLQQKEKERLNQNQAQSQNIYNSEEDMRMKMNEIPLEYKEMYMRQQMMQQQKEQEDLQIQQQQEIPPEYKEMYMKHQNQQQKEQEELQRQQQEIPPEYKEMYMRQHMMQQQQERQKEEAMPNNYQNEEQNKKTQQEEIYNDYDMMQQQSTEKHGKSTPNNVKVNNFIENQQNYYNESINQKKTPKIEYVKDIYNQNKEKEKEKEKENKNQIHPEKQTEQDYKDLIIDQQQKDQEKEKEKEDENMEIYQNMLREKEKEQLEKNQENERKLYEQYLLNQQNPKEQNINQIMEDQNKIYPYQYQERESKRDNNIAPQEIPNKYNIKPPKSFEEYYNLKGMNNIPEQLHGVNSQNINEEKYRNYPPSYPNEMENYYPQKGQGFNDQDYLMYQQQRTMSEMEERERARQIIERQQMEKMRMNDMNPNEYYSQEYPPIQYNPSYDNKMLEKINEFKSSKMEYLQNKQKNLLSKDNIFAPAEIKKPPPKYNNEPLTNADRLRIQREYAQFLDEQINAKSMKNKERNNGLGQIQETGYEVGGPNPYQQLRDKHNKLKDIPQDPYSVKNYNISSNSYLTSNPITNPVNSYKFVDRRRVSSGRFQNNGSNIIGK